MFISKNDKNEFNRLKLDIRKIKFEAEKCMQYTQVYSTLAD